MKSELNFNNFKKLKSYINEIQSAKKKKNEIDIGYNQIYGKYIKIDDILIALDHWNPNADIIFISHAHFDHIPNILPESIEGLNNQLIPIKFICSKITKEIAEVRTRGKLTFPESSWLLGKESGQFQSIEYKGVLLTLIENGHVHGSTSLLIEGSQKIFYTGDFITNDREFFNKSKTIIGLRPIKCDHLIIECTFGAPNYIFPSFKEIQVKLNEYIEKNISEGNPVILLGYSYGKSQMILKMLNTSHKILLDRNIAKNVKILEKYGVVFPEWEPYGNYNKNKLKKMTDYILIIPPYSMFNEPYKSLISEGAKVVYLSGKVLNDSNRKEFPADKYISYSDHCDFKDLLEFIKKCNPNKIYLEHGRIEEFSYFLSKTCEKAKIFSIY
ncbi:MAG: MBL fold metallo-hydrolase RNA specificity domain-containing protein [Promethearchaeota archaeon]